MCTHNQCFRAKKKKNIIFHLKINIFTVVKYSCILHGRVCVVHCMLNRVNTVRHIAGKTAKNKIRKSHD